MSTTPHHQDYVKKTYTQGIILTVAVILTGLVFYFYQRDPIRSDQNIVSVLETVFAWIYFAFRTAMRLQIEAYHILFWPLMLVLVETSNAFWYARQARKIGKAVNSSQGSVSTSYLVDTCRTVASHKRFITFSRCTIWIVGMLGTVIALIANFFADFPFQVHSTGAVLTASGLIMIGVFIFVVHQTESDFNKIGKNSFSAISPQFMVAAQCLKGSRFPAAETVQEEPQSMADAIDYLIGLCAIKHGLIKNLISDAELYRFGRYISGLEKYEIEKLRIPNYDSPSGLAHEIKNHITGKVGGLEDIQVNL